MLSNELKTESAEICASGVDDINSKCTSCWPDVKIIISLAIPRLDGLNAKVELVNAMIKFKFMDKTTGNNSLCDNIIMANGFRKDND